MAAMATAAAGRRVTSSVRFGVVEAAGRGFPKGARPLVDRRGIFGGLDAAIKTVIGAPQVSSVFGQNAIASYEERKSQGTDAVMEGVNRGLQIFDVPFHVGPPPAVRDLTESAMRKRLKHLQTEQRLIERYLEQGLVAGPPGVAPKAAKDPEVTATPQPDKVDIIEQSEGEEYFEPNALSRKLKKWYTIDAHAELPFQMMSSFELYPQWIPWCTSGTVLESHPSRGTTKAKVGFGIKVPIFGSLGDDIEYEVTLEPPSTPHGACRVYTVSNQSRYMTKLVYDWRFVPVDANRTKVILELQFEGRAHWCMPIWEALRKDVVNNISDAFCSRVVALQASAGGDSVGRPELRPRLESLRAVLQGPLLRSNEAVVVTEGNGRTIRHANQAFAAMVGRPLDMLSGVDIPDLLQSSHTNPDVLRGVGTAIRNRLPATAVVLNRNKAGQEFMNRFSLAPLDDDERDTGVVFWAILKAVESPEEQRLSFTSVSVLEDGDHWAPDYEHPQAFNVRQGAQI